MTPAVIYARYSSYGQTEQSIEGQLHDGHAWAERNGYTVIGEYIDRALTGTKDARPDFQRMIRDAERRQFEAVIVWKLDRFARNRYDSAIYKARLKKCGVRVVSVMENITDSPEGIILEGLLESMAEYYSANLSENVKRGQRESVAKGWFPGGNVPYGYLVEDHHLVEDPRDGPVAREIFRRYADGETLAGIAADLNRRGIRTRGGSIFRISSFDAMVRNPAYIGQYTYNGQVLDGCSAAIIDEDVFRRAQARREKNKRAPAAGTAKARYLLQGKIFCGHCGSPMIGESGYSHTGAVYNYYSCNRHKKRRLCKKKNERKSDIEAYVARYTRDYILEPGHAAWIAEAVAEKYRQEFDDSAVRDAERRLAQVNADLEKLVDSLIELPASARPRIAARMEQLETQRLDLETSLAKLRVASRIQITADDVRAWIAGFRDGDIDDEQHRQDLFDYFVNSVYVYDDRLVIWYNLPGARDEAPPAPHDGGGEGSSLAGDGLLCNKKIEPGYVFIRGMIGIVVGR